MADQCSNELPGSIVESFTLAIELVGDQIKKSPELLTKILTNPEVQKKIKESLQKRLDELQAKSKDGRPIDSQQALQAVQSVFTVDIVDLAAKQAKNSLEQSAKFRQLKTSLEGLACKFKASPTGAFYDEANGVLLILTVGVMIGGAVGMYIAATGDADTPLALASKIAQAPSVTVLGKIDLGLTDVVLKPSEKKYDAGIYAKVENWKAIKNAELKVVVQTKDEKVSAVPISVETKIAITPNWFNTFGASYEPIQHKATFALGIAGTIDSLSVQVKANLAAEDKKLSYGGSGSLAWKPVPGVPINITGGLGVNRINETVTNPLTNTDTRRSQTDLNMNLGLKIDF